MGRWTMTKLALTLAALALAALTSACSGNTGPMGPSGLEMASCTQNVTLPGQRFVVHPDGRIEWFDGPSVKRIPCL